MDIVFQYGLQGVIAFGSVGIGTYIVKKYFKIKEIDPEVKIGAFALIFFIVGYIPADLGADLFNRIKLAVRCAITFHAGWTALKARGGN